MAHQPLHRTRVHGIWGNYDVRIHLPEGYVVGATGVKQSSQSASLPTARQERFTGTRRPT